MRATIGIRRLTLGGVLAFTLSSCAAILSSAAPEAAPRSEPPESWPSAIQFLFQDPSVDKGVSHNSRAQFHDGTRPREVTNRDMVRVPGPALDLITPWYRLRPPAQGSVSLRVILEHADGAVTAADYLLPVHEDLFYTVYAVVGTRDPDAPRWAGMPSDLRGYPLSSPTRSSPGDSLWISHSVRSRECFACPT